MVGHDETPGAAPGETWSDVRTRPCVVHALACAGASFAELARLADDDRVCPWFG